MSGNRSRISSAARGVGDDVRSALLQSLDDRARSGIADVAGAGFERRAEGGNVFVRDSTNSLEFRNEILGEFISEFTTEKPHDLLIVEPVFRE